MKSAERRLSEVFLALAMMSVMSGPANAAYMEDSWNAAYGPSPDVSVPPGRTFTLGLKPDGFVHGTVFVKAVPEPGSLALLAIGLIGLGVTLSRRRSPKR